MSRVLPLVLIVSFVASCGLPGRLARLSDDHGVLPALEGYDDARAVDGYPNPYFQERFDRAMVQLAERPLPPDGRHDFNILVLSSGGVNGSFGAGVLTGWSERGDRPEFDMVTGVSVGSLLAPFAYVGEAFDHRLEDLFRRFERQDIHREKGIIRGAIWGESLLDNAPLAARIERAVDHELMAAMARRHAEGSRCFIGSTNLDNGQFVIWDLGQIATRGTDEALQMIRRAMRASVSIPVVYPPVRFGEGEDDELHVDGAVMRPMFLPQGVVDARRSCELAGVKPENFDSTMYVVHNGSLLPRPVQVDRQTLDIAIQTVNLMSYTMVAEDILHLYVVSQVWGADFRFLTLPDGLELSVTEFSSDDTERLFLLGRSMMDQNASWADTPPGYIVNEDLTNLSPSGILDRESQHLIEDLERLEAELRQVRRALEGARGSD